MNLAVNPISLSSSTTSWKSTDAVSDQFPAGLRVLVVDDDPTCLKILERMLRSCHYEVTKCSRAEVALKLLRDNQDGFDVVISDVHMPDMDGFELLEQVGLKMDLPVIMMSADDSQKVVMKGVTHGACDYLIKPVRMEALKNIWQHVVRKKKHEWKDKDLEQSGSVEDGERNQKLSEDIDYSSSANEGNWKSSKKRKDEEDDTEERDDTSALKKPRVVWSVELHQQFVTAVNQLGIDKAVPKKILELMNVPGLTRENVASHLQKYRLYLRRLSGQHQNGLGNSFMSPHDGSYGSITSYHGLDLQSLASSGQLPPQSLATIQAAALSRSSNKSAVSVPLVDKPNIFSYDNSKIRGQQQHNNGKQVGLLHGIPTNMDSKQLAALHQSAQPFGNINMNVHSQSGQSNSLLAQMAQTPPRTQLLNAIGSSHGSNLPSSVGQQPFLGQYGINNVCSPSYTSLSQSSSSLVDFSRTQGTEFSGSTFSTFNSKAMLNEELNSEMKGSRGFVPNFDVFNEVNQNGTEDWGLQNAGPALHSPQPSNVDLVQWGLTPSVSKAAAGLGNNTDFRQQNGLPDMGFQNGVFPNQIVGQEDLMSALLKQHDSRVPVENEFGFDEYHLDNLPV